MRELFYIMNFEGKCRYISNNYIKNVTLRNKSMSSYEKKIYMFFLLI